MTDPQLGSSSPLVPPLYQSSVYTLPDLNALDAVYQGGPGYIYARDSHPNGRMLANALARLESAAWGLITGSGMGALSAACLALLQHGDRVIASHRLYGRTTTLLRQEFARYGVKTTFVDACDLDQVRQAFDTPARLLLVETLSNPMLRVVDVPALAEIAHSHQCRLVVDNTFATPVLYRPLEAGADLVMESLTKMIGGHADVTLGALCGNDVDLLPGITQIISIWGLAANPFDCWLTERGLATLDLRTRTACANAAAIADWLAEQSAIAQVVYPGRTDHPEHALAKRLFPFAPGHMLCFELQGDDREVVNRFMRKATGIPFSPSLGNTSTTCSHPATTSHRFDSPAEKKRQGINDRLIRLSVGIEPLEQIKAELQKGWA